MKIDLDSIKIIKGNLSRRRHQVALIRLINAYLSDEMGEGRVLTADMESRLVLGMASHPSAFLFFAEYKERLVGLAACFVGFSTFYAKKLINIHDLIVLPEYRRNAVAEKILLAVEKKAKDMDCCRLVLEVRTDNAKAMGLYRKFGFDDGKHPMYFWVKTL